MAILHIQSSKYKFSMFKFEIFLVLDLEENT